MKNLLNSMKKQGGKPIICCCFKGDEKPLKPYQENGEENQMLIEDKDEFFTQRLKHDIHIWGQKGYRYFCPSFYFFHWLLWLDGHAFILAIAHLEPLVWRLVEQRSVVERSLLASLDAPYERC